MIRGLGDGVLDRWLARGDALTPAAAGRQAQWRHAFDWHGHDWPVAALTRQADVGDAAGAHWLRADPAHVRADMTTARMLACGALGLTPDETQRIARDLKPLFGDAGFLFDAATTDRWYLRAEPGSGLPDGGDPDEVLGDDLKLHLPAGAAGKRWRMLFNEAQVLLHNHVVNVERERRGAVAVNGLWFWGGGALPERVRSHCGEVVTRDPALRMLATSAGACCHDPDPQGGVHALGADSDKTWLIDLNDLRDETLETHWLAPVDAALRRGRLRRVELAFVSGERIEVRAVHRWRFWRRMARHPA
ncbi:MAG: phosphoglycerate mutase [Dokdonella sp.]|nr:phosphoglycerate mutase [Dokdonella sp.]MCW5568322.1 phosphoglycerate mutase [Dokdonella sp.]